MEEGLQKLVKEQGIAAVPHGFRSSFDERQARSATVPAPNDGITVSDRPHLAQTRTDAHRAPC